MQVLHQVNLACYVPNKSNVTVKIIMWREKTIEKNKHIILCMKKSV